jgi:hypothetical protein
MATKAGLISAINGFITSVVNITKHRNSMLELVNELYPATLTDDQSTTNVFTATQAGVIGYQFTFKKRGNIVFVTGVIINFTTQLQSNPTVCSITNSEFLPSSIQVIPLMINASSLLVVGGSTVQLLSTLPADGFINVQFYYFTND